MHSDDKKNRPLQVADMIASMGKESAFRLLQDPPELEMKVRANGTTQLMPKSPYISPEGPEANAEHAFLELAAS